jgi:hypothetical protein
MNTNSSLNKVTGKKEADFLNKFKGKPGIAQLIEFKDKDYSDQISKQLQDAYPELTCPRLNFT